MTIFFRLLADKNKNETLLTVCDALRSGNADDREFNLSPESFRAIPGTPFSYWVSEAVRGVFDIFPPFESEGRIVRQGLATADDFRFVRAWWEVKQNNDKWPGFAKGGRYSPFYADVYLVVNWKNNGAEIKNNLNDQGAVRSNVWMLADTATKYFRKPGLTWPSRASKFAPQALPANCLFSQRGYLAHFPDGDQRVALGLFNSAAFDYIFKTTLGRFGYPEFLVGILKIMPMAKPTKSEASKLDLLARRGWSLKRALDTVEETSHAFQLPAALRSRLGDFDPPAIENELARVQAEIDVIGFDLYGFSSSDRAAASGAPTAADQEVAGEYGSSDDEPEDKDATAPVDLSDGLLSWAVGVAFGRFDFRLATGERAAASEPDPFDPLPAKSPGMLPDNSQSIHRHPGFLVGDPGHPHDLAKLVEEVLVRVDAPLPKDIRRWLQRDFFSIHLQHYSKSRRKAPIYWQIGSASGLYNVWLYAPDVNSDTFFRLQQDVLEPKITNEERGLAELSRGGSELSSRDRLEIEKQEKLVEELKQLGDEVRRVAPLWNPDLDDGTVLVMAPLWRMVGHHRQWQKELRTRWEELQAGKHDWSHQAIHLWPERVIPKCAEDRSLAIAHGLEDVFWFEPESGKWAKRDVPKRPIAEIVRERTSDAVKAALKELLEAPEPAAAGGRSRRKA